MAEVNQGPRRADFVESEANGNRSRDKEVLILGQNLKAGAVLGKITASGKFTELAPGASDGSEAAAGILYGAVDATAADQPCVNFARDGEVNSAKLLWPAGITGPQQTTAEGELRGLHIIPRPGMSTAAVA